MLKYTVVLSKKAVKQLDRLPEKISEDIIGSIVNLEKNPKPFVIRNYKVEMDIESDVEIIE